jgi:hypothetical protein
MPNLLDTLFSFLLGMQITIMKQSPMNITMENKRNNTANYIHSSSFMVHSSLFLRNANNIGDVGSKTT